MKKRIEELMIEVTSEMSKDNHYPYLPDIFKSLQAMKDAVSSTRERRSRMGAALGRIVTEDYAFSESQLGDRILKLVNDFSKF